MNFLLTGFLLLYVGCAVFTGLQIHFAPILEDERPSAAAVLASGVDRAVEACHCPRCSRRRVQVRHEGLHRLRARRAHACLPRMPKVPPIGLTG